uniref:(northern house mosquito) hypothetical protein n=1 Tax=Culex pipiens TaxID=7175 RepID=A0A8D8AHL0_CULPI
MGDIPEFPESVPRALFPKNHTLVNGRVHERWEFTFMCCWDGSLHVGYFQKHIAVRGDYCLATCGCWSLVPLNSFEEKRVRFAMPFRWVAKFFASVAVCFSFFFSACV